MNIFGLDIKQLDPDEARAALSGCPIERLPGVPPFLSEKECAVILGVSMKIIDQLTASGALPVTDIPGDFSPCLDLFGQLIEPQREKVILRVDLINFLEKNLLCNKPILDT
jgi:hypothetical protein